MSKISRRSFLAGSAGAAWLGSGGYWCCAGDEPPAPGNPFLEENFAPVQEEIVAGNLEVVGRLPRDLRGMFVRNGPNPQHTPIANYHWFDGAGMLHGVRLEDGKASYRNRWVRTAAWQEAHRAGKAV